MQVLEDWKIGQPQPSSHPTLHPSNIRFGSMAFVV